MYAGLSHPTALEPKNPPKRVRRWSFDRQSIENWFQGTGSTSAGMHQRRKTNTGPELPVNSSPGVSPGATSSFKREKDEKGAAQSSRLRNILLMCALMSLGYYGFQYYSAASHGASKHFPKPPGVTFRSLDSCPFSLTPCHC